MSPEQMRSAGRLRARPQNKSQQRRRENVLTWQTPQTVAHERERLKHQHTLIRFYHILWLLLGWLVSHNCWRVAGRRGMSMQRAIRSYTLSVLLALSTVAVFDSGRAAENATGFYILGLKTTMAGF